MKYFFTLLLLLSASVTFGQRKKHVLMEAERQAAFNSLAKTTIADPAENNYNVHYLRFDLVMTNVSTYMSGAVNTAATVSVTSMTQYVFELDSLLTIDSFLLNGQLLPVSAVGFVRTVNLPAALSLNTSFTARVVYHGQTPAGNNFFTHGLVQGAIPGGQMVYSVSDMYLAKDWWPCKQALQDKIDSVDMYVTVPTGLKVGSNGLLRETNTFIGGSTRYHWKTNYPIDYYLISVAIAPYSDYSYYTHFTGSNDSMLVQNYIYDSVNTMQQYKANIDTLGMVVDYFSQLFGRYPFWKEKYGMSYATLQGGMEHQTMTTIGILQTPIIAHELGHQWWGDHVTYGKWEDIWLSEGWASYCEQLFVEHYWGAAAAKAYRTGVFNTVLGGVGGSVITTDTNNAARVFDSRLTYAKGAAVAHMLRFIAPTDSVYFSALRTYQQQFTFGLATTADLKNIFAQAYVRNLDTFFNQWLYGEGYPIYAARYYGNGSKAFIKLIQTTSKPSVTPRFYTPVQLKIQSGGSGDTTITIYNNADTQLVVIPWTKPFAALTIDPDNQIVDRTGLFSQDASLQVSKLSVANIVVSPNPAADTWYVANMHKGSLLTLTDVSGRLVWQKIAIDTDISIPAHGLVPGVYTLRISSENEAETNIKLTH